jgi:hypothetical protein
MAERREKTIWVSFTKQEFDTELEALLCDVEYAFDPHSTDGAKRRLFAPDRVGAAEKLLEYAKRVRDGGYIEPVLDGNAHDVMPGRPFG